VSLVFLHLVNICYELRSVAEVATLPRIEHIYE
jgi:hypothetical protein